MPTADGVLNAARSKLGLGENPPGSNHNEITEWYGAGNGAWCAMFVSWSLAHAGFSADGGQTLVVPGVVQTTHKGWAYVPYLLNDFRSAGWEVSSPQPGDIVTYDWDGDNVPDHTGLVESVLGDGSIFAIEGNTSADEVQRMHRVRSLVAGFCRVPYDGLQPVPPPTGTPPPGAPAFPGYCSLGSRDNITRRVQQRLVDRGWQLGVDGVDGDFGQDTLNVVRSFQSEKGLDADGVVGPLTWNALWTAPVTP
jgi:peptidoglycan hydrolase-like protein with peptidoglycan-binding domain